MSSVAMARQIPRGELLYSLGSLFAELRYRIELAWCDFDECDSSAATSLDRVGVSVAQIVELTRSLGDHYAQAHFSQRDRLRTVVEKFWSKFPTAWGTDSRRAKSKIDPEGDPESEWAWCSDLIANSPIGRWWTRIENAFRQLASSLPKPDAAVLNLGFLLSSQVFPTFTGGQRKLGDGDKSTLAYYAVDLSNMVHAEMFKASEHYPVFQNAQLDLSVGDRHQIHKSLVGYHQQFLNWLRDPACAPAHLGIIFDRNNGRVHRGSRHVDLSGDIAWGLLMKLSRSGDNYCTRDTLMRVWGIDSPTDDAFNKALSTLNRKLKKIGIRIGMTRNIGRRLEEISIRPHRSRRSR